MGYDELKRTSESWDDDRSPLQEFLSLYHRFRQPVHHFFARRCHRCDECSDLVQETFLRAYRSASTFRGESLRSTWLLAIAHNVWLESLRRRSRLKRCCEELSLEAVRQESGREIASPGAGALRLYLDKERRSLLSRAFRELPPQMRRCLRLRLVDGLRYREIADELHVSIGTVKSQLAEARNRLRQRLDRDVRGIG